MGGLVAVPVRVARRAHSGKHLKLAYKLFPAVGIICQCLLMSTDTSGRRLSVCTSTPFVLKRSKGAAWSR